MVKKYIIALSPEEREYLKQITRKGKNQAYKVNHARILLKADINSPTGGLSDQAISQALDLSIPTLERVRKRFVEEGLEAALSRKEQLNRKAPRLNGEQEAHLIALTCSEPPQGQGRWTLRLLAQKMVELEYVEQVSYETVRQTLKKMNYSLGKRSVG